MAKAKDQHAYTITNVDKLCRWASKSVANRLGLDYSTEQDLYQECWLAYLENKDKLEDWQLGNKIRNTAAWYSKWLLCGYVSSRSFKTLQALPDNLPIDERKQVEDRIFLRELAELCNSKNLETLKLLADVGEGYGASKRAGFSTHKLHHRKQNMKDFLRKRGVEIEKVR